MKSVPTRPTAIVILTADNGAWLDAHPDAGTTPLRGEKRQ
jgi:arylsulfatase A-like enzyme